MEGCGKRIDLYHNEYAICGKNYGLKVYFCDACESARNLAQPDVKPPLCEARTFTKDDLQAAFHSGICFWSEKHGWEQDSFERWFSERFA